MRRLLVALDAWCWRYEDRRWVRPFGIDWMLPIQRLLGRVLWRE